MATLTAPTPGIHRGLLTIDPDSFPKSQGSDGQQIQQIAVAAEDHWKGRKGETQAKKIHLSALLEKVEGFGNLQAGWNGRRSPAPTPQAIEAARFLIRRMVEQDLDPTRLAPSAVGGVGVTRRVDDRIAYVECYNDGSVHAIFSDDKSEGETHRVRLDRTSVMHFLGLMGAYLNG